MLTLLQPFQLISFLCFSAQTKRILSLDIGLLISGAKERGELEGRVTTLLKEIKESGEYSLTIFYIRTRLL